MTVEKTLQFVIDLKIILQKIKSFVVDVTDPFNSFSRLLRDLEQTIQEFESYLRFPSTDEENERERVNNGDVVTEEKLPKEEFFSISTGDPADTSSNDVDDVAAPYDVPAPDEPDGDRTTLSMTPEKDIPSSPPDPVPLVSDADDAAKASGGSVGVSCIRRVKNRKNPRQRKNERRKSGDEPKLRCRICLKGFRDNEKMQQHVLVKHEGGNLEKQICPFCGKTFEKHYLKGHIAVAHEGKEVRCDVCDKSFTTVSGLNVHRKNVHEGRRFACHNCNKSYASKSSLDVHVTKEHAMRTFPCRLCESVLKTKDLLRRHMLGIHERVRHSCPTCSASFTQKSQLTYHVKLKHGQGEGDGRLVCEKCKKVFVVPWKMREHRRKCVMVMEGNVGYAEIAASLASRNELPEKDGHFG